MKIIGNVVRVGKYDDVYIVEENGKYAFVYGQARINWRFWNNYEEAKREMNYFICRHSKKKYRSGD